MRWWPVVLVLASCLRSSAVVCEDGRICAADRVCDEAHGLCVHPDQLAVCATSEPATRCEAIGVDEGTCIDGVCLPAGCGNQRVDHDEQCDDGNRVDGDGCSADCRSTEACGNQVVDLIHGESCDDGNRSSHDGCSANCAVEQPRWRRATGATPSSGTAAYVLPLGQIVLVDGSTTSGGTYGWGGASWSDLGPGAPFPPRDSFSVTYDARRHRLVVFGGISTGNELAETWEWDGATWAERTPALSPAPSTRAAMAYDPVHRQVVLVDANARTWLWDGVTWTMSTSAGRSPRVGGAMAYDAVRGRVVLFGGVNAGVAVSETWEWNGTTWMQPSPPPPTSPPRRRHAVVAYDPSRRAVVVHGGLDGATRLTDTWAYDGATWSQLAPAQGALPAATALVFDHARARLTLLAGGEVWSLGASAWQRVQPATPTARFGHAMSYDPVRGRTVLFGDFGFQASDTWEWDGSMWTRSTAPAPSPRFDVALAYDPPRGRTLLFGGEDIDGARSGETWAWDGTSWAPVVSTTSPGERSRSASSTDVAGAGVLMFGGSGTTATTNDTWRSAEAWTELAVASPAARQGHRLALDVRRGRGVLFGGQGAAGQALAETWEWDGSSWSEASASPSPPARLLHAMTYDIARRRVLVFGGVAATTAIADLLGATLLNDLWEWDGAAWSRTSTGTVTPFHRGSTAMVYDAARAEVVLFGGYRAGPLGDTWTFRYQAGTEHETCRFGFDTDGDSLIGCEDPDCWGYCDPWCPPGTTCPADAPRCGDGTCGAIEDCRLCPIDCGACTPSCGDGLCDPQESCVGDCS